jgi:transposase
VGQFQICQVLSSVLWTVECAEHGVVVEHIPWSDGKRPVTYAMMGFLARWARRLSWRETARAFQTSWEAVYRSVEWFVEWGVAHRQLRGVVESIGVDEIHWGRGLKADNFLTVIYQIDTGCRRLLWVGRRRSQATLRRGLKALGPEVIKGLRFLCSDMWKPYLKVIAAQAGQALHVLDRFHITSHLNQAVDQVRRAESTRLGAHNKKAAQRLTHMRWPLLRRGSRARGRARQKQNALLASKLATARAWDLKETFSHFRKYKSEMWAGGFLLSVRPDVMWSPAGNFKLAPLVKFPKLVAAPGAFGVRLAGELGNCFPMITEFGC